jgi:hypothetical protein
MRFLNMDHKIKFTDLIKRDKVQIFDVERQAVFYILSANEELYNKIQSIYNFEKHDIQPDILNKISLSSVASQMLQLGYSLLSGTCKNYNDVNYLFSDFDIQPFEVCVYALRIFFGNIEVELTG